MRLHDVKIFVLDIYDQLRINKKKKGEIKKYEHPKRKEIYSKIILTQEQKSAIDELYQKNYGEKIPYTWHQHFTAFTGKFDVNYFPELLFIPEFEHFMNLYHEYSVALSDKNLLPLVVNGIGVRMPKTYISITKGVFRDADNRFISKKEAVELLKGCGKIFGKPSVDSNSGKGCMLLEFLNGKDKLSGKTVEEILDEIGEDFVFQERIICHKSIQQIYPCSVNTFRIVTYRWKDKILHFPTIMRIGQKGSVVDNAHAGGVFIGIKEDGQMTESAFTEFKDEYKVHPDTGVVFAEQKITLYPKLLQAAEVLHEALPQIGIVNWDFTIDEEGTPVLIEANIDSGTIWMTEMAHGCGAFGSHTEEVLKWIRFMKSKKASERFSYAYGKMEG